MRVEEFFKVGSNVTPVVGGKCTIHYYSDAEPAQIVGMSKSGKTLYIRVNKTESDASKDLYIGHQDWIIKENEFVTTCADDDGEPKLADKPDNHSYFKVTKRKDGSWRTVRSNLYVDLNQWKKFYDWSF